MLMSASPGRAAAMVAARIEPMLMSASPGRAAAMVAARIERGGTYGVIGK